MLTTAQSSNLELRAARQQRALAIAGITTAGLLPNPTLSFAAAKDSPHEGITLDLPLELGGKRGKRLAVAREEQRSIEIDVSVLERQIRRRTRQAFYQAVAAQTDTAQAKVALDLATRTRDMVQARFQAGDVAQLDVIQAEVEVARANADYETAAQAQRSAEVLLAGLLNRSINAPLSLSGKLDDLPASPALDAVTTQAMQSNADLQKTAQDLRTEEKRLALAKSQRIPNLDLQPGLDFNSPPEFHEGGRGGVSVAIPLFNRGQGDIALSNARLSLLRLTLESQRLNASAQVAAAYFDFVAKLHQAEQYRQNILPQSERLLSMAEDSYRAGKTSLLTLIDAQRRLNDVRKAYLDSLLAAQNSFAALEEVVGAPLD
ncbi:MAG TPA: TolC family protein [Terriglobales bacterium]|nr:TolC family protein [Terriglobales bacterium]